MRRQTAFFRAFTLIELLVVIAIIAVLAAILFPVFAQAKSAAKESVALAHLNQVGTAAALYLADNDDTNPQGENYPEWVWPFIFYPYAKQAPQQDPAGGKNTIYWSPLPGDYPQYLAGEIRTSLVESHGFNKQFHLTKVTDPAGFPAYTFWSSIAINEALVQEWPTMTTAEDPVGTIYFTEAQDTEVEGDELLKLYGRSQKCVFDGSTYSRDYLWRAPNGGYQGGNNSVFMDLHVKWHALNPFDPAVMPFYDRPEDAWCSPNWVFPTGSSGGPGNCGTWSPKIDHMDQEQQLCIDGEDGRTGG